MSHIIILWRKLIFAEKRGSWFTINRYILIKVKDFVCEFADLGAVGLDRATLRDLKIYRLVIT